MLDHRSVDGQDRKSPPHEICKGKTRKVRYEPRESFIYIYISALSGHHVGMGNALVVWIFLSQCSRDHLLYRAIILGDQVGT